MEINIVANIKKENFMGVDITVGQTEHAIKEISKKVFDKD
jgi:hypothetical protein